MKKLVPILFALVIFALQTHGQLITRGAEEGEIYLSKVWYINQYEENVHAIWRSTDNGRHLTNQYASTTMPEQGTRFDIVSDATPGVLYGWANDSLFISYNYAQSWGSIERCIWENYGNYTSGTINGELYKRVLNQEQNGYALEKSTNYGLNFNIINNNIPSYFCEVGVIEGELFSFRGPIDYNYPVDIYFSNNNGLNFILQSSLDPSIGGYHLMGYYPTLSRGAASGELYLATWHLPCNYHIYYSSNYGQTFQLQYQSDECDFYYWGYSFSAGREPGSFYVSRGTGNDNDNPTHTHQYIDYSTDYGKSFTTFFHDTDIDYSGNPSSITHTVSAIAEPLGYGTVEGFGRFAEGTEVTVTATPNEGYEFVNWTESGEEVSELAVFTFDVERTLTLVANFKLINGVTLDNASLFKSFPNPFSSVVTFEYPLLSSEGLLSICSVMGNTIFTGILNDTKTSFDLSHLPQGAYIYSIEIDDRLVYRGILIKNSPIR